MRMTPQPPPPPHRYDLSMTLQTTVRKETVAERQQRGKDARKGRSRAGLGQWSPAADRPDPVALLAQQEVVRVQALLPLRHERMSASAFAFYRGGAAVMANDLGPLPSSGLVTQLCGDAHLSNFGVFAAPDRSLVFDVNDFDETHPGPFEWDVFRLATSFVLAGRDIGLPAADIAAAAAAAASAYRAQMQIYAGTRRPGHLVRPGRRRHDHAAGPEIRASAAARSWRRRPPRRERVPHGRPSRR